MRSIGKYHPLRAAKKKHGEAYVANILLGSSSRVKSLAKLASSLPRPKLEALLNRLE